MSRFSGQTLEEEKQHWLDELDDRIDQLEQKGKEKAKAEKEYRKALSKKLLVLPDIRSGDVKTNVAKGFEGIAELREKRDIAVVLHETCQQSIYQTKIELGVVEGDILHERVQR